MSKNWLPLKAYWFNRTVAAACTFMGSKYCNDFEPKVVIDILKTFYGSRVQEVGINEGTFGRRNPEGNFNGLLGKVQRGAYDIALCHVGILHERFDVIGYTRPYVVESVKFAVRKGAYRDVSSALIRPFKFEVWLTLMFSAVLCGIALSNRARKSGIRISLSSTILIIWETFLQKAPNTYRCFRMPLLIWSLLCVTLAQWYLASLQSFLTTPTRVPVISTLRELNVALSRNAGTRSRNAARICLQKEGFAHYVVERSTSPLAVRLKSALHEDPNSQSSLIICSIRLAKEHHLVTVVEGPRIQRAADAIIFHPQVQMSSENLEITLIAAASSKHATSLPYFDQLFSSLMETGIFKRHLSRRKSIPPDYQESLPIGKGVVRSLQGFAYTYGIGMFCLVFEVVTHRLRKRNKRPYKSRKCDGKLHYYKTKKTNVSSQSNHRKPRKRFRKPDACECFTQRQQQLVFLLEKHNEHA